jgi:GWxTD domain-containing protein
MKTFLLRLLSINIILILCSLNLYSKEFKFYYDFCSFKNEDNRLFLEFYYSFDENQLKFIKTNDEFEAAGLISIEIKNLTLGTEVVQKLYKVPVIIADTAGYNKRTSLTGQLNFLLDSGKYAMQIIASDYNDRSDSVLYNDNLILNRFPADKFTMSGIQLCNNIEKSNDLSSIFYKNTLEVIPNPLGLFGNNLPSLYYYYELYNLTKDNLSESYTVLTQITDLNSNVIKSNKKKYTIKNNSKVDFGNFDIRELKTNSYKVEVKILDDNNNLVLSNQKNFQIYNSEQNQLNSADFDNSYLLSEYSAYSEDQLNTEFKYAMYIANETERQQFEIIKNTEGKRKFLYKFWLNKEITKTEYFNRIRFVNSNFKYDFKEGYTMDRGRVYCLYGKPNDIEKYPFQSDTREYEIWRYDAIQGGVIFVFIDMSNDGGNFVLTHSTAQNEIRNDNWPDKIKIYK